MIPIDISKLQEELTAAKLEAQNAAVSKARFLANMNHELRTPLNAIIGFSEILRSEAFGPLGSPRYAEYAQAIMDGGRRLSAILDSVLEMAQIEAGKVQLQETEIALPDLIGPLLQLVHADVERGGLRIDSEGIEPVRLYIDERAVRRALLNLLTNAVKFTNTGGHIRVSAQLDPARGLQLRITDTGIGMDEEDIPRLLEPFTQASEDLARVYEGGGLGLPIAKALLELHDIQMSLTSKKGYGTQVTLLFPRHRIRGDVLPEDVTILDFTDSVPARFTTRLEVEFQGKQVSVFNGSGTCLLGRNRDLPEKVRCDLIIDDQRVSRPHASIRYENGGFVIHDQSRRGTYILNADGTQKLLQSESARLGSSGAIYLGMAPNSPEARPIHFRMTSGA